jgi:antitoxin VapB
MALSIRNPRVEELARSLAAARGESITEAILEALEARLTDLHCPSRKDRDFALLKGISRRVASLPDLDTRNPEEIIGYDENGLPG